MAIVLMVPLGLLAIAIAVLPVLLGSIHAHRVEAAAAAKRAGSIGRDGPPGRAQPVLTVNCPICLGHLNGGSADKLVDAVHRHAWQVHGIPSSDHILESASRVPVVAADTG